MFRKLLGLKPKVASQKPEKRQPIVIPIPKEHVAEAYRLFEIFLSDRTLVNKHRFWQFISEVVPEWKTLEPGKTFNFDRSSILAPKLVEDINA